jgi:rhomboid protease GluP
MEYAFVCSETKGEHNYGFGQSDEKLQRWMSDLEYHMRGTIRYNAMMAHFFKVIHQSDNIEQYMEAASSYLNGVPASAKKDVILLEISNDKVDGCWNNVVIILVTLAILIVILALLMGLTGGVSRNEYDDSRRFSNETMRDVLSYFAQKGNFLLLLPPLLMIGWGLYMIFNGYTLNGSNNVLFDESGACTPDSLLVDGEWWRIFTSMFIHADFMHIFGNLFGYVLGVYALSRYLYGRDIALVFLITGPLSIAFAVLYSQNSVIGASGGVFGLYGAFLSLLIGESLSFKFDWKSNWWTSLVFLVILVVDIFGGFSSNVSISGHISGLVSGAIVVWLFRLIYYFFDDSYREFCR